jgi:predicted PurR-regulated permease PerM
MHSFNQQLKQVMILLVLLFFIYLVAKEIFPFLPGLLGALTLYILSRSSFFQLTYQYHWKKGWTAGMYLLGYCLILLFLVYVTFAMLEKQVQPFIKEPGMVLNKMKVALEAMQLKIGFVFISAETLAHLQDKINVLIPSLLNDTANLLANLAILLFVLYYMLINGREMEAYLVRIIPLKKPNIRLLADETKRLVKVNALGIPLISIVQGVAATIGYMIFGTSEAALWGFLTGIFAFFPVVGTMIIWVPLVAFMYANGNTWNATGLGLYSLIVTGNVDYIFRITFLKKLGDMHPLITVLGVIVGLNLFGFIGLIFGPLLVNYVVLLFRIYINEFLESKETDLLS